MSDFLSFVDEILLSFIHELKIAVSFGVERAFVYVRVKGRCFMIDLILLFMVDFIRNFLDFFFLLF